MQETTFFSPSSDPRARSGSPTSGSSIRRVDRRFELTDSARLLVYLEVLNATNRSNGEEYAYSSDYARRGVITGLPALAVLGGRVEF